jgi:hypothetical protein
VFRSLRSIQLSLVELIKAVIEFNWASEASNYRHHPSTTCSIAAMLRSFTTKSISGSGLRTIVSKPAPASAVQFNFVTRYHSLSSKRPRALVATQHSPFRGALLRFKTTNDGPSVDKIDTKGEAKLAKAKLVPDPAAVSGSSSVRQVFEESQAPKDDVDMLAGIKADIVSWTFTIYFLFIDRVEHWHGISQVTIKDTFGLQDVPKKSLYLGAAGLIPYAATSLSTVYLAFDINHAKDQGSGYLFSPETAHQLLAIIEPIQIGYGAVVSVLTSWIYSCNTSCRLYPS